jgi:hypothetical protein
MRFTSFLATPRASIAATASPDPSSDQTFAMASSGQLRISRCSRRPIYVANFDATVSSAP